MVCFVELSTGIYDFHGIYGVRLKGREGGKLKLWQIKI